MTHDFKTDLQPAAETKPLDLILEQGRHRIAVIGHKCSCGKCNHGTVAVHIEGVMEDELMPLAIALRKIVADNYTPASPDAEIKKFNFRGKA